MIAPVTVVLELSLDDYVVAQQEYLREKTVFRVGRLLLWSLVVIAPVVWFAESRIPSFLEMAPILFLLAFALGMSTILRFTIRRNLRSNPAAHGPQTYTVSEEGLSLSGSMHNSSLAWPAIVRVRVTERNVFFYVSSSFCYFLPRRVLVPEQLTSITAAAIEHRVPLQRTAGSA